MGFILGFMGNLGYCNQQNFGQLIMVYIDSLVMFANISFLFVDILF
mgnify:CR=1 FL=1